MPQNPILIIKAPILDCCTLSPAKQSLYATLTRNFDLGPFSRLPVCTGTDQSLHASQHPADRPQNRWLQQDRPIMDDPLQACQKKKKKNPEPKNLNPVHYCARGGYASMEQVSSWETGLLHLQTKSASLQPSQNPEPSLNLKPFKP